MNYLTKLPNFIFEISTELAKVASQNGNRLYLVGGVARDVILGKIPNDPDYMLIGDIDRFIKAAVAQLDCKVVRISEFRTAKLEYKGCLLDIAECRKEVYPKVAALPKICPATQVETDLARRDFSVNSMAISLNQDSRGVIIDPFSGLADCENRVLRLLHSKSIRDDPTRIYRAIYYSKILNLSLEPETREQILSGINCLPNLSTKRVLNEFNKICRSYKRVAILKSLNDLNAWSVHTPSLNINSKSLSILVNEENGYSSEECLLIVIFSNSIEHLESVQKWLISEPKLFNLIQNFVTNLPLLIEPNFSTLQINKKCKVLKKFDTRILKILNISKHPKLPNDDIYKFLNEWNYIKPILKGADIKKFGVVEGKFIGMLIEKLEEGKLNGKFLTVQDEIDYVKLAISKT